MKKYWRIIGGVALLMWLSGNHLWGQMADPQIASLQQTLAITSDANEKIRVLNELSKRLNEVNPREARKYADDAFKLSGKTENKNGETLSLVRMAQADYYLGNYDLSKAYFLNAIDLYQNTGNKAGEVEALRGVCDVFSALARNYKLKNDDRNAEQYTNFYQIYLKKYETATEGLVEKKLTASIDTKKENTKKENTENNIESNSKNELTAEQKRKILDEIKHSETPQEVESMTLPQKETEIKHLRREKNKKDKQITALIEENLGKDDVLDKQRQIMYAWIIGLGGALLAGGIYALGYLKTKDKKGILKENTTVLHEKLNRQEVILREKEDILKKKENELAQTFLKIDEAKLEANTLYQLLGDELQPQIASMAAIAAMENPSISLLRQQTTRLNTLVNSTIAVGQWERQKNALTLVRKPVKEIADQAINNYSALFAQKNIVVENRMSETLSAQIQVDATLNIFANLLDNALRYAPKNSKIILDAENITQKDAEFIKISQTDFGKNIPINSQKSTFGKIPSTEGRPSAWNLVYVKLLVESQGGQVNVESSEKETIFGFTLKA